MTSRSGRKNRFGYPESLLHYIWQHQQLQSAGLKTTDGQEVLVRFPGWLNSDAGPDFRQASIRIGSVEWTGSVEIHIRASDYRRHGHRNDPAYETVILHVVWDADEIILRSDGTVMPALEVRPVVAHGLLHRYLKLSESSMALSCASFMRDVPAEVVADMIRQAAVQRLSDRVGMIRQIHTGTGGDWDETCWRVLAWSFGLRVNGEAMLTLASRLPAQILLRYRCEPDMLQAFVFGMSGLMGETARDTHEARLMRMFVRLRSSHRLIPMSAVEWKFSRMRPAAFPTQRLAQLIAFIGKIDGAFSDLLHQYSASSWQRMLACETDPYWRKHVHFGRPGNMPAGPGAALVHQVRINALAPLLVAWGSSMGLPGYLDKAVAVLEQTAPEDNHRLRCWYNVGIRPANALESQALLGQLRTSCGPRRCLDCGIGNFVLRPSVESARRRT